MRILLKLIVVLIIIAAAALVTLLFVVDPNDYKQEISSQVEKATGRKLTLEGDIGLSVFPRVALELGSISLSNAEGFNADSFAKVGAAKVRIELMPLLQKKLVMDTIVLDGLVLNLEKNKAGKNNWDDFAADDEATEPVDKPEPGASSDSTPVLTDISIAGIKLTNASILWSDATTGETYRLEDLNLSTDPLIPGEPAAIDVDFKLVSLKPDVVARINFHTRASLGLDDQQYNLRDTNFTAQTEGAALPFSQAVVTFAGNINADMARQLVTVDNFSLKANASKAEQVIDASLSTLVTTDLAHQKTTLKAVDLSIEVTDPALPGGKTALNLTTDINADMQQQTMMLSALAVRVHDLLISGDIKVSKLLSDNPDFNGHIGIKPFNLRELAHRLAIELPAMADDSTLEFVQLETDFSGSSKQLRIQQLDLTLDKSKLRGHISIDDFINPAIDFRLALNEMDIDGYLPPESEAETPTASPPTASPPTATAAAVTSQFPLDTFRQINAKGVLNIGQLTIKGTHSEKIHLEMHAANGLIKLHPLSANLYHGQFQGNISLDARGKALKLAIHKNLKNVQVGPLLKDLTGDDMLSGTANAKIELRGTGSTVGQMKQTLAGSGRFSFTDGAVKGINIADSIRRAEAALKGETLPASSAPLQTDFSSLTGSFTAAKGIISNQDLVAKSPLLRINGAGKIDLPTEGIDYGLKVTVVGTYAGQGGRDLAELKGLTIPVKITGNFAAPKPTVDLANLIREQASQEVKNQVADKLKDELGEDLGGIISHALGTSPTNTDPAAEGTPEPDAQQKPAESPEKQLEDALKKKFKGLF
jgi:AsmA protein